MKRFFVLAGMGFCAAVAARGEIKEAHVPADAKWVLHLDLKALNESPMGQFVRRSMDENAKRGMASLQAMSGINLTNDVDSLVVYGKGDVQAGGVMHAYGRFDIARLTTIAGGAKEFQNKVLGTHSLLSWSDKGKRTNLCFIDPTLAIMAQSEQQVREAVALVDGPADDAGRGGPFAKVLSHTQGRFFAMQANNLAALAGSNPQLQMFKQAEAMLLEVSQMSGANGLDCVFAVKAPSREQAQQLSQAAQGLQALFLLQASQNPEAAAIAQGVSVALQEDFVTVNLKLTEENLQKMVQVRIEQQRSAQAARRAARKAAQEAGAGGGIEEGADGAEVKPERPVF